ncbi:polysaccharide deacetylase family protein [Penicillium herquei]|nr:polysaccharide deacetylase family protein [Penicillium herquei]
MGVIPAQKAVAFFAKKGEEITVINTDGNQVICVWAFDPHDAHNCLSTGQTRSTLMKIVLAKGDTLQSTQGKPFLTLTEDSAKGVHDMICSPNISKDMSNHGSSWKIKMHEAIEERFPEFKIPEGWAPDPLNLFMNVIIDHRGSLNILKSSGERGEYVTFTTEQDLIMVLGSCQQNAKVTSTEALDCEYGLSNSQVSLSTTISPSTQGQRPSRVKIALSIDFDALSHWLGSSAHPDNKMSDYAYGIFSGQIGAFRVLDLLRKNNLEDKVTWFIPGHTMETFPDAARAIIASGAEIGLHGYTHEDIYSLSEEQERDVLLKCVELATTLTGKRPVGYRSPVYTLRESTLQLLRENGFLYDSSLSQHDSQVSFAPNDPPLKPIDLSQPAASWMQPTTFSPCEYSHDQPMLVEIPTGFYNEDMMPMTFFPTFPNSKGWVSTRIVEQMWKDKFLWLLENSKGPDGLPEFVFPVLLHPDCSGMAHIIGMIDRFVQWLQSFGSAVEFCTHEEIATSWLEERKIEADSK